MKRIFDVTMSLVLSVVFCIPMMVIALIVRYASGSPVLYWSNRIGINNKTFKMPKFRTMKAGTPSVATHLLEEPEQYLTSIGRFLRKYSLDELPQLFCILKGDLSFVGPRPALYNQYDLISLRTQKKIDSILPGITGWAQINGRDEIPIPLKVFYDEYYMYHRSFFFDFKIILATVLKVIKKEGVCH